MKLFFRLSLFMILLFLVCSGYSQINPVTVIIEDVSWSGYEGDEYGPRLRLYQNEWRDEWPYLRSNPCMKFANGSSGSAWVGRSFDMNYNVNAEGVPYVFLIFVSHEERKQGSDDCTSEGVSGITTRHPDRYQQRYDFYFYLNSYAPGVYHSFSRTIIEGGSRFTVNFRIIYSPGAPNTPTVPSPPDTDAYGSPINCANKDYTLNTSYAGRTLTNENGVTYQWQFRLPSEDYDPPPTEICYSGEYDCYIVDDPVVQYWIDIGPYGGAGAKSYTFNPKTDVFPRASNWDNRNPTTNRNLVFRVRAIAGGRTSPWSPETNLVQFAPAAPTIANITTNPSCSLDKTGSIVVSGITGIPGVTSFKFALRASGNTTPCNPLQPLTCSTELHSKGNSDINNTDNVIPKVSSANYALIISNNGGAQGVCYTHYPVSVNVRPDIAANVTDYDVACNGGTGRVTFNSSGGHPTVRTFDLSNNSGGTWSVSSFNSEFNNLPVGSYELSVSDGGCSTPLLEKFEITQPARVTEIADSYNPQDPDCLGDPNGYVTVGASRTTGSYDVFSQFVYSLTRGATSVETKETVSTTYSNGDLLPGSYTLEVYPKGVPLLNRGCNGFSKTFVLNDPPQLKVENIEVSDALCYDSLDGKITFEASGGRLIEYYHFSLSKVGGGTYPVTDIPEFSGLAEGEYTLSVTQPRYEKPNEPVVEACPDQYDHPVTIYVGQPEVIEIDVSKTDVQCYGFDNGITEVDLITGGIPDYKDYTWERYDPSQTQNDRRWIYVGGNLKEEGLIPGSYRFRLRDQHNCPMTSDTLEVVEPPPMEVSNAYIRDIICLGGKGDIVVEAIGGNGGYHYEYAFASTPDDFAILTGERILAADDYIVKAVDRKGCEAMPDFDEWNDPEIYTITEPEIALDFSFEQQNYNGYEISCKGFDTGNITLTPIGGNDDGYDGYWYARDNGLFGTSPYFDKFTAGNYDLRIRDQRGCVVTHNIRFDEPDLLTPRLINKKDVYCFGDDSGEIAVDAMGGVKTYLGNGGYEFQLNAGDFSDTKNFTGLTSGKYTVTVKDINACTALLPILIENINPPLQLSHSVTDVTCFAGQNGAIDLSIAGGAGDYRYNINGQSRPEPFQNLLAGTYDITITDDDGCQTFLEDVVVNQPSRLVIDDVDLQDIVCAGGTASIAMTASGGTPSYTYQYSLDNGATFTTFSETTPLFAGTYRVLAVDHNSCITLHPDEFRITEPAPLDFTFTTSDYNGFNISCFGGYNGHIAVSPSGGNGFHYSGYEYKIDTKPYQVDNKLAELYAGDHVVLLRDARGCVIQKSINLTQSSEQITARVSRKKDVTCVEDFTGELEIATTGGTLPYKYKITDTEFQASPILGNLKPGEYTVIISDANDCAVHIPAAILSLTPEMQVSSLVKDVSCFNGTDGAVEMTVQSGAPPFSYRWTGVQSSASRISQLRKGDYAVTVTDDAGCKKELSLVVNQPAAALTMTATATTACYGQPNGLIYIEATGGTTPYQYSSNNGGSFQNEPRFSMGVGTYTLKVQDAKGCYTTTNVNVTQRNITPQPNFLVAIRRNALDTLVLTDISVPKPDSIHWIINEHATVLVNDPWSPSIKFSAEGIYAIGMEAFFGGCGYVLTKNVTLSAYDPNAVKEQIPGYKQIQKVSATPNPSTGAFNISVELDKARDATVIVYDMLGAIHHRSSLKSEARFTHDINLGDVAAGIYLVRIITERDAEEVRVSVR